MRNLKRALSLALASVMLLGMMVVGAGAAYSDADKISNVEAAEVVSALGIMSGNTDGSFNPQGVLKRGEFAVLLAQLMNAGKFDSSLYKNANLFTDVTWAAGFVNYAANNGWISGYGDGKFGQEDEVTTAQALLIVCNALKIPVSFESGYQIGALAAAEKADILDGITDLTADKGMTRENAAQLILNAAQYSANPDQWILEIGGQEMKFDNQNDALLYYSLLGAAELPYEDQTGTILAEDFGVRKYRDTDDWGRPATVYTNIEGDEPLSDDLVFADAAKYTFTKATSEKAVYALVGKKVATEYTWTDASQPNKDTTTTWAKTANGQVTELFVNATAETVTVVTVDYQPGVITAWYEADEEAETKEYVTINDQYDYYTADFSEDDVDETYVIFTAVEADEAATVELPTKVAGKVTKVTGTSSFVVDGKTYEFADNYAEADGETVAYNASFDLYLDKYGYVIISEKTAAAESDTVYAVIEATDTETALFGSDVNKAQITYTDGKADTIDVDAFDVYASDVDDAIFYLIGLEYNTDDKVYEIVDSADYYEDGVVTKGVAKIGTNLYANANTIFMVAKYNSTTSNLAGYDIYTGIKNVPSMTAVDFEYFVDEDDATLVTVAVIKDKAAATSTTTETIFVLGNTSAAVTDANGTYYTLKAIVKGEITTIDVKQGEVDETANQLVKSMTKNDKGLVTAYGENVTKVDATGAIVAAKNDTIKFDGAAYTYAADAVVYEIDGQTITKLAGISAIKSTKTGETENFWLVLKDNVIIEVYLGV